MRNKILISLFLATCGSADSAVLLDFTGLTDTSGMFASTDLAPQGSQASLTFDISSLDPSLAGVTATISSAGTFANTNGVSGDDFQNSASIASGTNSYTVTFSSAYQFTIMQETNHFTTDETPADGNPTSETDVLTIVGGMWDPTSFAITGGSNGPVQSYASGNTVLTVGPQSSTGTAQKGQGAAEWEVSGSGTSFTFEHSLFGKGTAQSRFSVMLGDPVPAPASVPEPTSAVLLGIAGVAFLSRRKR